MLFCLHNLLILCLAFISFLSIDYFLEKKIEGKYYLLHLINNLVVVFYSFNDVISIYSNLYLAIYLEPNYTPLIITIALHLYHIIWYYSKLRFDDWLHHILMIFILIPLAVYVQAGLLINHALFFLTGLPGGIDYLLLFLNRNNLIDKLTEKEINSNLNLWIRAPGCIAHSVLGILCTRHKYLTEDIPQFSVFLSFLGIMLTYWNGIYFMNQVVRNYVITKHKLISK
jgi:hypothetical protein